MPQNYHPPEIRVNDSIAYKLLPEQRPTNPDRIYHAIVTDILFNNSVLQVDLLDPEMV